MRKIKEVLRLKFEVGLGLRQIARSCSIGLGTTHKYLERAEAAKITWPLGPEWDDWAMAPLSESERRDFWEICEDRYQVRSTILTSQLPVARWHEQVGDPMLADGILEPARSQRPSHRDAWRFNAQESRQTEHITVAT